MAECLLQAQPVLIANHIKARRSLNERSVTWLATASGWAWNKHSSICSGKICAGFIIFGQCCLCDYSCFDNLLTYFPYSLVTVWVTWQTTFYSILKRRLDSRIIYILTVSAGYKSAINWNDLPFDIRACDSVNVFKRKLKTHLFNIAYAT